MFSADFYYTVMGVMVGIGFIVFFVLLRITAGYGMMYTPKWGPALSNRIGWILMELPAFGGMLLLWLLSERVTQAGAMVCGLIFLAHYFQRTFIFPLLMRGHSRMPVIIMLCGMVFNLVNSYLIGGWLFWLAPENFYDAGWLTSWQFIAGCAIWVCGVAVNMRSDYIVRHLRKPGDTRHYIPRGGMYRYVTSANYLGELIEWAGYALLTWSLAGLVFFYWTFANLAPRARSLHARYISEFGDEYRKLNRRYLIPFIY